MGVITISPRKKSEDTTAKKETATTAKTKTTTTTKKATTKKAQSSTAKKETELETTAKQKVKSSTAKKASGKEISSASAKTKTSSAKKTRPSRTKSKVTANSEGSGKTLIIVESPSKAATLSGMLGRGYIVKSSKGHMKDLPKSRLAIDIEHDFAPEYILVKGKASLKNELLKLAANASHILLASDPDREGEAIAWHLADILGVDLSRKCRVRFYEITANAVRVAVKNPDYIDMNKVDAQQARRILDRLVGYTLSPLLWKKIRYGLSAGRVQSVALNLICQREREIRAFIPDPYYIITARAENSGRLYELRAYKLDGKSLMKNNLPLGIDTEEKAQEIIAEIKSNTLIVTEFKTKNSSHSAPAPFRTSTLQQEASRKLGMAPAHTMRIAQALYEGVNIPGREHSGLITYMRTDSLRISNEALASCREFIAGNYPKEYLPDSPNVYAAGSKNLKVQDAHEAIRPTDITLTPELLKEALTPEQHKLYTLIWRRFTASQMTPAVTAKSTVKAQAGRASLKQEGETLLFDGWSKLWPFDMKGNEVEKINADEVLELGEVQSDKKFTKPPARYSEAGLIKTLEENGVGRPSTYATIAGTLESRGYIEKNEERRFSPSPLGMTVDEFLAQYFNRKDLSSIVDAGFTAQMEKELDEVEESSRKWLDVVGEFWSEFSNTLHEAEGAQRVPLPEPESIGEACPECGHDLVKKRGRFGEFIACSNYPACKYTRPILTTIGVKCPKCGEGEIVRRKSKKGRTFYGCSRYPECDYVAWNRPAGEKCPECGEDLFRKGSTIFCAKCKYKAEADSVNE
ncbi:MAG: type I DNA topoisomerase [Synergistaceae bacterium]|nr:type I DNA topoisomerase [Synergistaceae bacterium]